MAKIYWKGNQPATEVSAETAEEISRLIEQKRFTDTISIGNLTTTVREVKSVFRDVAVIEDEYDLNDPSDKEAVLAFEKVLAGYDALRPYQWEHYCKAKGYFVGGEINKYGSPVNYRFNINSNVEYEDDLKKYHALAVLKEKRRYAKKMTHLGDLNAIGLTECPDKPGTENRCIYCYPKTLTEFYKEHTGRTFAEDKKEIAEHFTMPVEVPPAEELMPELPF